MSSHWTLHGDIFDEPCVDVCVKRLRTGLVSLDCAETFLEYPYPIKESEDINNEGNVFITFFVFAFFLPPLLFTQGALSCDRCVCSATPRGGLWKRAYFMIVKDWDYNGHVATRDRHFCFGINQKFFAIKWLTL